MPRKLTRIGLVPIEDVLPFVPLKFKDLKSRVKSLDEHRTYHGFSVRISSHRLICFAIYGTKCAHCGMEGRYFAVERSVEDGCHLNLYALGEDGDEILMTRDHVTPKSKGGTDAASNAQTLCSPCNAKKADEVAGTSEG